MMDRLFACVWSGFARLRQPPPGTFQICPVCFWDDDDVQYQDPLYRGGANSVSLAEALESFLQLGAISKEHRTHVRPPTDRERNGQSDSNLCLRQA